MNKIPKLSQITNFKTHFYSSWHYLADLLNQNLKELWLWIL